MVLMVLWNHPTLTSELIAEALLPADANRTRHEQRRRGRFG